MYQLNNINIRENASLSPFCSMNAGGTAKYICTPTSIEELKDIIILMQEKNEKVMLLGNASNVLFSDDGFDGAVIITTRINDIFINENNLTAYCGASLTGISVAAQKNGLSGLEFAYGIPGTVGGGVYMNAGAYGGEINDCFLEAVCLDKELNEVVLKKCDMDFSYRRSSLQSNGFLLLKASFELQKSDPQQIKAKMDELMLLRKSKQPLEFPSCGSTFKRPQGYFAGALIEQCGLKGYTIGGAQVSEKHSGFIINKENAKADDIIRLIDYVSDCVFEKTGVRLEPEIRIIRQR